MNTSNVKFKNWSTQNDENLKVQNLAFLVSVHIIHRILKYVVKENRRWINKSKNRAYDEFKTNANWTKKQKITLFDQ